jgi:hypothetical protein
MIRPGSIIKFYSADRFWPGTIPPIPPQAAPIDGTGWAEAAFGVEEVRNRFTGKFVGDYGNQIASIPPRQYAHEW